MGKFLLVLGFVFSAIIFHGCGDQKDLGVMDGIPTSDQSLNADKEAALKKLDSEMIGFLKRKISADFGSGCKMVGPGPIPELTGYSYQYFHEVEATVSVGSKIAIYQQYSDGRQIYVQVTLQNGTLLIEKRFNCGSVFSAPYVLPAFDFKLKFDENRNCQFSSSIFNYLFTEPNSATNYAIAVVENVEGTGSTWKAQICGFPENQMNDYIRFKVLEPELDKRTFAVGENIHFKGELAGTFGRLHPWSPEPNWYIYPTPPIYEYGYFGTGYEVDCSSLPAGTYSISMGGWDIGENRIQTETITVIVQETSPLKILSPHDGEQFEGGTTIYFEGKKNDTVARVKWEDRKPGETTGATLKDGFDSFSKIASELTPGTHTIILRGIDGYEDVSDSVEIVVKEKLALAITEISFLDGGTPTNATKSNKNQDLYDRLMTKVEAPNSLPAKGVRDEKKFLTAPHWKSVVENGNLAQRRNYPVSYIRSNATFLGGESLIKLKVKIQNLTGPQMFTGRSFKIIPAGQFVYRDVTGNSVHTIPMTFKPIIIDNPDFSNPLFTTAVTSLPAVSCMGELILTWDFLEIIDGKETSVGQIQKTPSASNDFHQIFVTYENTKTSLGIPASITPNQPILWLKKQEEKPCFYLELTELSSKFSSGLSTPVMIREGILNGLFNYYRSKEMVYTLVTKFFPILNDGKRLRGLDILLDAKVGGCEEYERLTHALIEIQGIDVKSRHYSANGIKHTLPNNKTVKIEGYETILVTNGFLIKAKDMTTIEILSGEILKVAAGEHVITNFLEGNVFKHCDGTYKKPGNDSTSIFSDVLPSTYETNSVESYFYRGNVTVWDPMGGERIEYRVIRIPNSPEINWYFNYKEIIE